MAYGDITEPLLDGPDTVNSDGLCPVTCKVNSGMVAAASATANYGDLVVKTFNIAANGAITATGQSLTVSAVQAGGFCALIHVTGNIFLIAYRLDIDIGDYDGWMKTFTIDGSTGAMALTGSSWEYGPNSTARDPNIINVSGTLYVIAYHEADGENPGTLKTFNVSAVGAITATGESLTYDATKGGRPWLCHVAGDVYAIAYEGTGDVGYLRTFSINSSTGVMSGLTSPHTVKAWWMEPTLLNVSGTTYAIFYMDVDNDGRISTVSISDDGQTISNITEWEFDSAQSYYPWAIEIGSGEGIFVVLFRGLESDGYMRTWKINTDGSDGGQIDWYEFDPLNSLYPDIIYVTGDVYAIHWQQQGTDNSVIATVEITTPVPPVPSTHVFRSPDFGATWYGCNGVVATARDVAFNAKNEQDSFIVGSGEASVFSSEDEEVFTYEDGGSIGGACTNIATDLITAAAFVGTTEKLYKTVDWGHVFYEMLNVPVTDVAIGGVNLIGPVPSKSYGGSLAFWEYMTIHKNGLLYIIVRTFGSPYESYVFKSIDYGKSWVEVVKGSNYIVGSPDNASRWITKFTKTSAGFVLVNRHSATGSAVYFSSTGLPNSFVAKTGKVRSNYAYIHCPGGDSSYVICGANCENPPGNYSNIIQSSDGGQNWVRAWYYASYSYASRMVRLNENSSEYGYRISSGSAGANGGKRSTNYGLSWDWSAGPRGHGFAMSPNGEYLFGPSNTLSSHLFYYSTNYAGSWSPKAVPEEMINYTSVCSFAMDPSDHNYLLYAERNKIWISSDFGDTWSDSIEIEGIDAISGFICMEFDLAVTGLVYATTRKDGFWRSEDRGLTWKPYNTGIDV